MSTDAGASGRTSPSRSESLVVAEDVSRTYVRGRQSFTSRLLPWRDRPDRPTVRAVDRVSLSVDRGEVVGLAGPSGSGKSTLLALLAGLERPDEGRVVVDGTDLGTLSDGELERHRLTRVGFVFQDFRLLAAYTARTNVAIPLVELGVPRAERRERASALLERVGLGDRIEHRPGALSGGERQRVAIARALVTEPALVIADEPTGELDSETGRQVLETLTELAADRAVVVASHDRETLDGCDRVLRLQDGRRVDGPDERTTTDAPRVAAGPASDGNRPDRPHDPDDADA